MFRSILSIVTSMFFAHITGTPTSLLFAQEPDLNQLHVLKDCSNPALGHELVPILTMNEQMPEVLDILPPPPPPMQIQMTSIPTKQQQQLQAQQLQIQQMPQQTSSQAISSTVLTGVYTLTEEPELEAEENTTM